MVSKYKCAVCKEELSLWRYSTMLDLSPYISEAISLKSHCCIGGASDASHAVTRATAPSQASHLSAQGIGSQNTAFGAMLHALMSPSRHHMHFDMEPGRRAMVSITVPGHTDVCGSGLFRTGCSVLHPAQLNRPQ